LLQQRETELRSVLLTDQTRALESATGNAEVNDFKDAAEQENSASVQDLKVAQAHAELARIQAARQRLTEGRYGICEDCDEPIDERRLLAMPSSSRCTACEATLEQSRAA
jgi:DnaK suppressor protein